MLFRPYQLLEGLFSLLLLVGGALKYCVSHYCTLCKVPQVTRQQFFMLRTFCLHLVSMPLLVPEFLLSAKHLCMHDLLRGSTWLLIPLWRKNNSLMRESFSFSFKMILTLLASSLLFYPPEKVCLSLIRLIPWTFVSKEIMRRK